MALFNKDWNTYKRNWQNANGIGGKIGSLFTPANAITKTDIDAIKAYNAQIDSCVTSQTAFNRTMLNASPAAQNLVASYNGGKVSAQGMATAQNMAKTSTIGLTIAQTALNAAIGMGIGLLINLVVQGVNKLIHANEEAIESAKKLREEYEEFKSTNASNVSTLKGLEDEFKKLSKGVSQYGDNISLTTEQYERYKEIVQQIVGMSPSLAEGYSTENGYIADKNGLLERAIELQEIEYRNELRKITNLENLKTSMSGYIAEYKDALNGGIVTAEGNIVATTIDTDFKNSLWQLFNTNNRENYDGQSMAKDIMEALGIQDIDAEMQKYFNEHGYWQDSWFWNDYCDTIIENLDAVTNSISFEEVGLDESVFDQNLEKLESYAESYSDMKDSVQMANEAIQTDLGYIAEYADGYSELSTEQQKFVSDFLKGFDISDISSENAMGFLEYDNDKMASVKSQIKKFVEELSQDETTKEALADLYAIPTDEQSIGEFVEQFRSALETIKAYCEENGIEIPIAITNSEEAINELETQQQRAVDFAKDKFNGYDPTAFFKKNSINTQEEVDKWLEIAQAANSAADAEERYVQGSTLDNEITVSFTPKTFDDAWSYISKDEFEEGEEELKGLKDKLIELAEAGRLSVETFNEADSTGYFENVGISAEKAVEQINNLVDASTQLSTLSGQISKMSDMLADKKNGTVASADDLAGFDAEVRGLDSWEDFEQALGSTTSTMAQCQQAADNLATEWLNSGNYLENLTEKNKQYYITQMENMGIENAEIIVTNTLTQKKKEQAAMEEFLAQRKKETGDASYNLAKATAEEIKKFAEEKGWSETTTYALLELALKKKLVNGTTLDFSSDIASIYNYVKAINGAAGALKTLADIKSGKESRNYSPDTIKAIYESSQNELDNAFKTLEEARLNATTVDVSPTGSSTYSPSKSSTDNTKEEAGEVFDFIEIRLQNLMDMASKAKDKIDDLLSFGSKRKQTIQAINKTTKAIKAEIKAAKEYAKYADKVAKEAASDTSTSSTEKITSTVGKTIAQEAQKYVGVLPYVYGGKSLTSGADCSGFVQSLYAQYGISIPRVSSDQWNDSNATYVAKEDLQAGDLVFFASGGSASNPGHVGLYIGNGKMVHEPQDGEKAKISSIDWVDYVGGKHYASLGNSYGTNTTTTTKKTYSNKELERYKKLVRQGLISDDAIKTIKDENLSKAISDYKDWYEKSQDCIESIETLTDSLKELYETLAQNPIEKAADRVEDLDNAIELRNAQQENLKVSQTKQYKNLNDKNITAYKKEEKAYKTASDTTDKKYNSAVKEANKAQKSALKLAKKVKAKNSGLTVAELKKVRSILKAGTKEIPAKYLAKMTNQKLINKCLDYNEALIAETKMEEAKETANQNYALAKETTKRQTAELQKDTFDQFQEDYENKIYEKERKSQQAQNKLDLREAQGKYASAEQLKIQLSAEEDKLKLLEEEETKLRTQLKLIPEGTPEWYEAKEALAGVVDEQNECLVTQEEINDAINNIPIDKLNDAIEEFESLRSVISSTIELLEKRYRNVSSSLYEKDIEYIKGEISKNKGLAELYRQQYEEEVAKGNDQAASEALVNWKNAESTSNSLYSAMEDTYDAIWQNELSAYENIVTKIEYAQSNIQSLLGIIQDEMLVDNDTGELTDYGLAKESLYLEQFGNANEEVSTYKAELAELEEMWANGQSGLSENEYLEKKAELYQNLTDAVNDQVSAVQALIDITEQQMQAELNALKEVIDARVEALNEKKAYYDYDKNIRSQTKDIQSLDNQIAALKSAEDTYENRKELKLLEAQRQEAQEQLDETQLDHQIELLTNGLNDFYDEISEEYDDYIQELKSSTEAQHELVQTIKGAVASVPEIIEQATEAALATYGLQGTNILRDTDWQKSVPEQQVTKEEEIQPDLSVLDDENTDSTNSNTTAVNTNTTAVNTNTTAVNDLTTAINSLNSSGSGNVESVTLDAKAVYFGAVASEVTGGGITGSVDWSGTAKFATGGIVRSGISDRTNDKLLVRVNPDETILTKDFTDMLPTTVDIMKDLVKMPTVVPTTYSNSPVVNVSYDNLIRIDGNADMNTTAEIKRMMPEITKQVSTSLAREMKRNGF